MKKILNIAILALICFLLVLVLKFFVFLISKFLQSEVETIYFSGLSIIITFFFLGITYNWLWTSNSLNNKSKRLVFILFCLFNTIFFLLIFKSNAQATVFFNYIMSAQSYGWKGKTHRPNDSLGYTPIPGASGYLLLPFSKDIPMYYDKNGFRSPGSDRVSFGIDKAPEILFLGCSWTFGQPCLAEETFAYLTAKEINSGYINAGVGGYGLSQMYIVAMELIPKYKPKYVVLQYSPWLADRGMSLYAPSYFGLLPNPYFIYNDNKYALAYPGFKTFVFSIDKDKLIEKYHDKYLMFYFCVGLPYYLKELYYDTQLKLKLLVNPELKPAGNKEEVEKFAYTEMAKLAHENGAKVIILNIGDVLDGPKYSVYEKDAEKKILNSADVNYTKKSKSLIDPTIPVEFAQADSLLIDYLNNSESKNYIKEFGNWRFDGKDSVFVDGHPNPKAHRIIAESILLKITEKDSLSAD